MGEDRVILALTPGIPTEWVFAVFGLNQAKRKALRDAMAVADVRLRELARANADSVVEGDGLKMIEAVVPHYSGAVPIWSAVELNQLQMTDAAIGKMLGVGRQVVGRWRRNAIFCPLSLVRLVPCRGQSLL